MLKLPVQKPVTGCPPTWTVQGVCCSCRGAAVGLGLGLGDGEGDGLGDGEGLGDGDGDGLGEGEGEGDGDGLGLGLGLGEGDGLGDGLGLGDGDGEGDGLGLGVGPVPIPQWLRTKFPPLVAQLASIIAVAPVGYAPDGASLLSMTYCATFLEDVCAYACRIGTTVVLPSDQATTIESGGVGGFTPVMLYCVSSSVHDSTDPPPAVIVMGVAAWNGVAPGPCDDAPIPLAGVATRRTSANPSARRASEIRERERADHNIIPSETLAAWCRAAVTPTMPVTRRETTH